jgi:hypothetical protein
MDPWSNIETSAQEVEIAEINKFEKTNLGDIPASASTIRELITRFEVCHFKYQQHLKYIQDSIFKLDPAIDSGKIGSNHIRNGENAWINDKTGRSLSGQQYLWALNNWLGKKGQRRFPVHQDLSLDEKISKWLVDKTPDKERIVRLLIARLTYDWDSYEKLQLGGQYKELEFQICRMDICHYAFPDHLDTLIQAIGKMKPHKDLEGCGSYTPEIKIFITRKYSEIVSLINDISKDKVLLKQNINDQFRIWLYLCLAKTIKELTGLNDPLPIPDNCDKQNHFC